MLRPALLLFGALPTLAMVLVDVDALAPIVGILDSFFDVHCHRDPSRTLTVLGQRLPVCARCTGVYAGIFAGAAIAWPRASLRTWVCLSAVFGLALVLDVATEALGWRVPSLPTRFFTGMAFAYPAALAATLHDDPPGSKHS